MSRNIHILIQDTPTAGRRGRPRVYTFDDPEREATLPPPDDPEHEATLPPPDDPEHEATLPPPDDPEHEATLPPPDDPSGGGYLPYGPFPYVGYGAGGAVCPPHCCREGGGEQPVATRPGLAPRDYSGFVIVRLAGGIDVSGFESLHALAVANGLDGLVSALELELDGDGEDTGDGAALTDDGEPPAVRTLVSRPLIEAWGCRTRESTVAEIRALEKRAARTPWPPRHSLTSYWRVDLRSFPELVGDLLAALAALPEVDLAYRELSANDAQDEAVAGSAPAPPGAAYGEDQSYLDAAPLGIGARWAWRYLPVEREPVNLCDLEQRWNPGHQDLPEVADTYFHGANRDAADEEAGSGDHGTAVLGQVAAASRYGVQGGAEPVGRFSLSSHYLSRDAVVGGGLHPSGQPDPDAPPHPFAGTNGHVAAAIFYALVDPNPANGLYPMRAGDVLLLEVQRAFLPTEVDAADFDAIRLACALGVTVIEAAGNGGRDLDAYVDPDTGIGLRRGDPRFRDSGAVLVGAAHSALPHDRARFSNYGSRLDCYAWGDSVTSCGYGDLAGDEPDAYYTNTFSGTSSAAPIIAAAAALLQALYGDRGDRLPPREVRRLLSSRATGTPQGPGVAGHIGVMPNLCALAQDELGVVPAPYLRRHPCDDGAPPEPDDAVSSSPDVVVLPAGAPTGDLGEGPAANDPAPGVTAKPQQGPYDVRVRLRNRGLCSGCADVRLFASPAATLTTPDFWHSVPTVDGHPLRVDEVLQGDVLRVSDAFPFDPGLPAAAQNVGELPPFAFLAVAEECADAPPSHYPAPVERGDGLPPGGHHFDWAAYRAFLRRPGVAWRNVHRERLSGDGKVDLPFLVAGTPDQARRFDFEVVRRLPKGATVRWEVPRGLAAKLLQAQPLLRSEEVPGADDLLRLTLPARPRLPIPGVKLAAGVCALVSFLLADVATNGTGHSLALRQLWRGEEVGRITWYLVDDSA